MKPFFKQTFLTVLCYGLGSPLNAQLDFTKFEIGASMGTYIYQGDLTPAALGSWRTAGFRLGIWGSKMLTNAFSVRIQLARGSVTGDDAIYAHPEWRRQRNFNFTSPVTELSALLVWDGLRKDFGQSRLPLSPYLFAGAGFAFLNIKRDWSNLNASYFSETDNAVTGIGADQAHLPPRVIPVLPVGIGVRYLLSSKWSVTAETSYRFLFTDYLDGFSQAANPSLKDHYYTVLLGVSYRLGKIFGKNKNTLDCPVVRK